MGHRPQIRHPLARHSRMERDQKRPGPANPDESWCCIWEAARKAPKPASPKMTNRPPGPPRPVPGRLPGSSNRPKRLPPIEPGNGRPGKPGQPRPVTRSKNGDTLWEVSKLFKVRTADIKAWNGLKSNNLRPGQVLKLKGNFTPVSAPSSTAAKAKPSSKVKAEVKDQVKPKAKPAPSAPSSGTFNYTVRKNETLWRIATRFKVSGDDIRKLNGF